MTIGIAVLGCGRIGRLHAELLARRVPGAALVAVHDVVAETAAAIGAELGVPVAPSIEAVLDDPAVDAVAICTSTESHARLITESAKAGKAVFCEKPIALDLACVDAALDAVEQAGVALHVGFNRRFDPAHRAVREAVADGSIGALELLRITSRDPAPPPGAYLARSGGLFLDMTIHDFDMARFVTGSEVVEVYAQGAARVDPAIGAAGDVDTATVVLRHADGCLTMIDNSRRSVYGYDQRIEAFGSGGLIASENAPANPAVRFDGNGAHRPPIARFFLDRYAASFVDQWIAFVGALRGGHPMPVTGADGRAPLVIGLAATRSLVERRAIAL